MSLHGCTRSARGRRTIFQPLVISVHAARHAAHSRDERIVACRPLPSAAVRCRPLPSAAGRNAAMRAASSTRVRPKRFDAMSGNGAADGVQSGMLPAKTFEEFHRLERRLYESIPPPGKVTRHIITKYYRFRRTSFPTISLPDARA
ncbi:hypothetical protein [Burkholderia cepacia]|uniref:hypothetical protein n=1 Tax=Burkholderia cepacia TaxID=292 RepID=UPI001F19A59E|nr:hypothetical protein [Burkholderia cepacia]MCE4128976.1 hypothetical protein [Burkholderia cepacia]